MLPFCKGDLTGTQIFGVLKENQIIDPETETEQFVDVLRSLLSSGFLECEAYPIPPVQKK